MAGPVNKTGNEDRSKNWAFPGPDQKQIEEAMRMEGSMRMASLSSGQSVANYRRQLGWSEERIAQAEKDRGTAFQHVNVPPQYRDLLVNADGMVIPITKMRLIADVLDVLDEGRERSWSDNPLSPKLVGLLTLPLQMGRRPQLVRALRAEVGVVEADAVRAYHVELGNALAEMQSWDRLPTRSEYLAKLYDAYQKGLKSGNGGSKSTKVAKKNDSGTDPSKVVIGRVATDAGASDAVVTAPTQLSEMTASKPRVSSLWTWSAARIRMGELARRFAT